MRDDYHATRDAIRADIATIKRRICRMPTVNDLPWIAGITLFNGLVIAVLLVAVFDWLPPVAHDKRFIRASEVDAWARSAGCLERHTGYDGRPVEVWTCAPVPTWRAQMVEVE